MFIRFITEFKNADGEIETGVFQAAGFLRQNNKIYNYDKEHLLELRDWFNDYLEKPDRFNKAKRKNKSNISLSWFKSTATEHLQKMYEMKHILDKYDIEVTVIKRENPGYIIYEDDHQVSTLPHGKDKHFVK
jgi:hypothetical protein